MENPLVCALISHGQATGFGLSKLAFQFSALEYNEDFQQLAQLMGYSLSGYKELSYVTPEAYKAAVLTTAVNGVANTSGYKLSRVFQICHSYESGYGHGVANGGLDLSKTPHTDRELGEAYQLGYNAGQEARAVEYAIEQTVNNE
jgi:hypothetical protein